MKALFLIFHGFNPANGISKKICYQVNALQANGIETHLCYLSDDNHHKQRRIDHTLLKDYGTGLRGKILKRTEYTSIVRYCIREQVSLVYMRSDHNANPFTWQMVRKMRKAGIRVMMEIPTYPYDQEYIKFSMKLGLWVDRCFRRLLARELYRIVTFSNHTTIFGAPTLRLSNGIDFAALPVKTGFRPTAKELHLIGVAEIHYWHGFDRVVRGLADYYRQPRDCRVYFHIVGDFSGPREYDSIVPVMQEAHLEEYVLLHGAQHGKPLDQLFEQADLGVGSLGRHRSGISHIKTLKNREYAARGIPFFYSETDEDFEHMPYILKLPADDSPVDIPTLIDFYRQLHLQPEEIRQSIHHLSWKNQMKKVIDA